MPTFNMTKEQLADADKKKADTKRRKAERAEKRNKRFAPRERN